MRKKGGAVGTMPPTHYLSKPGGGGGWGGVAYKDRARPPPPPRAQRATCLLIIPTSALDFPSHGEAPKVDHVALHTLPTKHIAY